MNPYRLKKNKINKFPAFGLLTYASFIICIISGVLTAIPYNINSPQDSISLMLIKNQPAVLFRAMHYWSAQSFLILSIIHIIDHLLKKSEIKLKNGIWLRLTLLIPVIFYAMLSGFILKSDSESIQALNIFTALIKTVPLIGDNLAYFIVGNGKDFQIIYLHHIASVTIIIWLVSIEHSKIIMPNLKSLLYVLPIIIFISLILIPGINEINPAIIKGPWYFIGFQELLHWSSEPVWIIFFLFTLLLIFYYQKHLDLRINKKSKILFLLLFIIYSIFSITAILFRGENWKFTYPWTENIYNYDFLNFNIYSSFNDSLSQKEIPIILGKREACLACHNNMIGLSLSHQISSIGCSSCHLGNSLTLNMNLAHSNMTLTPGNLSIANKTCGSDNCHKSIFGRVSNTLMTTMSGVIAVDKYVFDESDSLDKQYDISKIADSPADKHLRGLCASCHLAQNKEKPEEITELSRGGGCSACHLNYEINSLKELKSKNKSNPKFHPEITIKISNNNCFGCHSRSGRIAANYEGWHETQMSKDEYFKKNQNQANLRLLADGRVLIKKQEDIHFSKGLDCIDCHNGYELMGDGSKYSHKEDQVKIECTDCHLTKPLKTIIFSQMDAESQKIINVKNEYNPLKKYLKYRKSDYPLLNVSIDTNGLLILKTKNTGLIKHLKKPVKACLDEISGHSRLDCITCHTSWSPQCVGCHTEYKSKETGWDNLTGKEVNGAWIEKFRDYIADEPALGIKTFTEADGNINEIITNFVPGMVLSIDKENKMQIFKRLFAPSFSHTIVTKSRECKSCHNNSSALGYGRGELIYSKTNNFAKWEFKPKYEANKHDNLPEDAWIPFLKYNSFKNTTRVNTRPFNIEEQKKILLVGACLECHSQKSQKLKKVFSNFKDYRKKISKKCMIPN
jgi:hypothetical protein